MKTKQPSYYTEHRFYFESANHALDFMKFYFGKTEIHALYACKLEQDMDFNSSMLFANVILTGVSDMSEEKMTQFFMRWAKSQTLPAKYLGTKRGKKR